MKTEKAIFFLTFSLALLGLGMVIYSIIYPVTNYPFQIGWSESGKIYAAYQFYAPIITGKFYGWPWMDAGRSLLDGLVFLIPNVQIWVYRKWVPFLFLISNFCISGAIIIKASLLSDQKKIGKEAWLKWLMILWGTLFLLQGPVYYHVSFGIVPVIWFYDSKKYSRTLLIIGLASIWEGLCRANWFLMPATVAIMIYLFQEKFSWKYFWKYIRWPVAWIFTGSILSFSVYYLYNRLIGYPPTVLNSEMQYGFFRSKLWPNDAFSMGLIPGIFALTLPVILLLILFIWRRWKFVRWERLLAIICFLGIYFVGGTIVSMRAGGGYDLHNYDTFFVLLLLFMSFTGLGAVNPEKEPGWQYFAEKKWGFMFLLLIIPVVSLYNTMPSNSSFPTVEETQVGIDRLNDYIQLVKHDSRPVLFINERHLFAFGLLPPIDIYLPYEQLELMEMAMAGNDPYLAQFWSDVESQKFSIIISERLFQSKQTPSDNPFWFENNVWSSAVAYPVQTSYQLSYQNRDLGFEVYLPKP